MGRPKKKEQEKKAPIKKAEVKKPEVEETEPNIDETPQLQKPSEKDEKEFKKTISEMEKIFGEGSITSASTLLNVAKLSTKNLLLDILTEGGLPQGAISLFYGPFSSGKTVQSLLLASIFTSQKIPVLYILTEGDIDINWVQKLGNDLKYFFVVRPDDLEKAADLAHVSVASKNFGLVIVDSLTAGIPRDILDKNMMQEHMALQARKNAKLVQKVTSALQPATLTNPDEYNNTMVILIAHLRMKVGFIFGSPETLTGGLAIQNHAAYIVKFTKGAVLKKGEEIVGREQRLFIEKSKYSVPLVRGVTEFYFSPPRFNNAKVLLTYAIQYGLIERGGAYYTYGDTKVQGQKNLLLALKEQKALPKIKAQLIKRFGEE